jgi:hypothetical protein
MASDDMIDPKTGGVKLALCMSRIRGIWNINGYDSDKWFWYTEMIINGYDSFWFILLVSFAECNWALFLPILHCSSSGWYALKLFYHRVVCPGGNTWTFLDSLITTTGGKDELTTEVFSLLLGWACWQIGDSVMPSPVGCKPRHLGSF